MAKGYYDIKSAYKDMLNENAMAGPVPNGMSAAPGGPLGTDDLGVKDARVPFVVGTMKRGLGNPKCQCRKGKSRCEKCGQRVKRQKELIQDCLASKFKVKELEEGDDTYNYELRECDTLKEAQDKKTVKVVCAWCDKDMGTKEADVRAAKSDVSHGICPDCFEKMKPEKPKK